MGYDSAVTAAVFAALGSGQEKAAIGAFIRGYVRSYRLASLKGSIAVVLGVGAGWELRLLKELEFARIAAYEPSSDMLGKARELVSALHLEGVTLYDNDDYEHMVHKWSARAHFVLGTHVIPALSDQSSLFEHFRTNNTFLRSGALSLAVTNNPQDQFLDHGTYTCHHSGSYVKDGDKIITRLRDVKHRDNGGKELTETVTLNDTFWSDHMIRSGIQSAGLLLDAIYYIRFVENDESPAPYVAYSSRRRNH